MPPYILAIDQGTTGSTAAIFSKTGQVFARVNVEFPQHFPRPGWVEHHLDEIWTSCREAVTGALRSANIQAGDIAAIGITNQRETTCVWNKKNGEPLYNAIVWQCRRTSQICEELLKNGHEPLVKEKTGLVLDAYFSATKIAWILNHVEGARAQAKRGELAFGTIDSFLVWKLTGGRRHITDASNASRTLLCNLQTTQWDDDLVDLFQVEKSMLPTIVASSETVGHTSNLGFLPDGIPISGIAGDQQASLFGQACLKPGDVKCTYGTGAFALMNTGDTPVYSTHGLLTSVAWKLDNQVTYALEGSSFVAGAAVQWLRDGLEIIKKADEIENLALQVGDSDGVIFVPALTGLGAPYWNQHARGSMFGLTRGTKRAHLARATLEGIAFSVFDLLTVMQKDSPFPLVKLRVDGGGAGNNTLMKFQADIAQIDIERAKELESTARGAAWLAGMGCGLISYGDLETMWSRGENFEPSMAVEEVNIRIENWKKAIRQTLCV